MTSPLSASSAATLSTMPTIFLAHGAPPLLDDAAWMAELAAWGRALPRPKSVLIISAHWEKRPATLGATTTVPLVYDYYGFPQRYYDITYPAPGAPELAARVRATLASAAIPFADAPERGLDHGAFIPLMAMVPKADIPVLQLSLPSLESAELVALGRALEPLRREGVLIVGSGFLTHNMQFAFRRGTPAWAREFDAWCKERIVAHDLDALADFRLRGPAARTALPTVEHYVPLLVAAGAASSTSEVVSFPIEGWWMDGAFTKRSVQFG